jgi:hypothetical protein
MMVRLAFLCFLFLTAQKLLALDQSSICPHVDWALDPRYPEFLYPDFDRDRRPGSATGQWICFNGTLNEARAAQTQWVNQSTSVKNADGSLAVDCNDNDPSRFMLVEVWPDLDGDGYTPRVNSEFRCYGGATKKGGFYPNLVYPEDEKYLNRNPNTPDQSYDCNDNQLGTIATLFYDDQDGDGWGAGAPLGYFCSSAAGRASSNMDCDDKDARVLDAIQYGLPDKSACGRYRMSFGDGRLTLELNEDDLEGTKDISIKTFLDGTIQPTARVSCLKNCPAWTMDPAGNIHWENISLDELPDATTGETGNFDPSKPKTIDVLVRSSMGSIPSSGYAAGMYLTIEYVPTCPELATAAGTEKIVKSGFDSAKLNKDDKAGTIVAVFNPICPSTGRGVSLKSLAKAMKIDHFNWWQNISFPRSEVYSIPEDIFLNFAQAPAAVSVDKDRISELTDTWLLDPQLNAGKILITRIDTNGTVKGFSLRLDASDGFPYYFDEGLQIAEYTRATELLFFDAPRAPEAWFELPGDDTKFLLRIAGVKLDGTFVRWSKAYSWDANWYDDVAYKPISFAKNLNPLTPPPKGGSATLHGVIDDGMRMVPELVGRPANDVSTTRYLVGSGFTYEVVASQVSDTVPTGIILSQEPPGWSEVLAAGEIKVTVSAGTGKACGSIPNGETTTRVRYLQSQVPFGSSCEQVKEIQTGTCRDGTLTFDGQAGFDSCQPASPLNCGTVLHGSTTTRIRYMKSSVPFGSSCESEKEIQTGTCSNGEISFSGTAVFESCQVLPQNASCTETIIKRCKAGLFQSKFCNFPNGVISVSKDESYRGSSCHVAPEKLTLFNALRFINSYSIENGKAVRVNLGCDAKFKVQRKSICP